MTLSKTDKRAELNAIKEKYGERYFANPKANKEACNLWGVESNENGVVQGFEEEVLVQVGACKASLKYIGSKSGYFLIGLDASTAIGGFGYAPSIWSSIVFGSYWDAREFAIKKFISYFKGEAVSKNSCSSEVNRSNAKKAAENLREELTPQLGLF